MNYEMKFAQNLANSFFPTRDKAFGQMLLNDKMKLNSVMMTICLSRKLLLVQMMSTLQVPLVQTMSTFQVLLLET